MRVEYRQDTEAGEGCTLAILDRIERMLTDRLGEAFMARCPALPCDVNDILIRFGRFEDTLARLHRRLDSLLFNTIYTATEKTMLVAPAGCTPRRITTDEISDFADRLLALAYQQREANSMLQDALFDFARNEGSYAAMRELLARFPLDAFDRAWLTQVLTENNQLT